MPKVVLKFKDRVLKEYPLETEEVTIGRNQKNDIRINNLAVSSFHAKIVKEGKHYFVEDLKSLNGTFVNDEKIEKYCYLNDRDVIAIGKHTIIFFTKETEDVEKGSLVEEDVLDKTIRVDIRKHKQLTGEATKTKASPEGRYTVGVLTVMKGSTDKPEYEIMGRITTIGKDAQAEIKLKGLLAPKIGAQIKRTEEGYFMNPPLSGKRPILNGKAIYKQSKLKDGDELRIGGITMKFTVQERGK